MTEGHRGRTFRSFSSSGGVPTTERDWADSNQEGYWAMVVSRAAYGFLLYNFAINERHLKNEHISFIHNNNRFQEWLRNTIHSQTRINIRGFASSSGQTSQNDVLALGRSRSTISELFTLPIFQPGPQHGSYNPRNNISVVEERGNHGRLRTSGFVNELEWVDPTTLERRGSISEEGHRIAVDRSVLIYISNPCSSRSPLTPEEVHRFAKFTLERVLNNGNLLPDYDTFWMPAFELFEKIIPAPPFSRSRIRGTQVPREDFLCQHIINGGIRSIETFYSTPEHYNLKAYFSGFYCSTADLEHRILEFISLARSIVNRAYLDHTRSLYHIALQAMTQSGFNDVTDFIQFKKVWACMKSDPNCLIHYL